MMKPVRVSRALLLSWPLPDPSKSESKEDRGRAVAIGGSRSVPGAIRLAGEATLRAGAGKLMVLTGNTFAVSLALAVPEAAVVGVEENHEGELGALSTAHMDAVRNATVVLVGPGMATRASSASEQAARVARSLVADAGSLHADALAPAHGRLIITPHIPEMADLLGLKPKEVAARPADIALDAARQLGAVTVLKGPTTWIATPDGTLWKHEVDAPGLGTSGSGDVLAGIVTGLVARGAGLAQAAVWGVAVHARAGVMAGREVGPVGFLARELLPRIPRVLARL